MEKIEASPTLWAILINGSDIDSEQARHAIIIHYQFLVEGMARKLKTSLPTWVRDDDLISYGQIGLIKAVDRYDPDAGPFRSFASAYVYGAILDELRTQDWAPRGLRRDQKLIASVMSHYKTDDEEVKPSMPDVADELGWTEERLVKTLKRIENSQHVQLETSQGDHSSSDVVDSDFSASYLCEVFAEAFDSMSDTAKIILAKRYFLNQKMTKIVEDTNISPSIVRQVHAESIRKIFFKVSNSITS